LGAGEGVARREEEEPSVAGRRGEASSSLSSPTVEKSLLASSSSMRLEPLLAAFAMDLSCYVNGEASSFFVV
jgi:hypothetical protein